MSDVHQRTSAQISRRNLLQLFALMGISACTRESTATHPLAAGTSTTATPQSDDTTTNSTDSKGTSADVLVIGAGMAGLAAARDLQKAGKKVIVLEGRQRIGGRIWTTQVGGLTIDFGASWIHGVTGNPLTDLAKQAGAATIAVDYKNMARFAPDGTELTDAQDDAIEALWQGFEAWRQARVEAGGLDPSLRALVDKYASTKGLSGIDKGWLDYMVAAEVEHEYAQDAAQLSAQHYGDTGEFPGGDVIFAQGYGQLVDLVAKDLDIRLGTVVSHIDTAGQGAQVTDSNGQVWKAPQVIVTLPLGVLQANQVQFQPALPQDVQTAIGHLGMGVLDKFFLSWQGVANLPAWPKAHILGRVTQPAQDPWVEWLNTHELLQVPALLGFTAGAPALPLESQPDAQVQEQAYKAAKSFFDGDLPKPSAFGRTAWGQDPFARGSYSSVRPGGSRADCDTLAKPLSSRLFLAGEHTHGEHQGTVHGALLSGQRAAAQVLGAG